MRVDLSKSHFLSSVDWAMKATDERKGNLDKSKGLGH